jgi:Spy/CpxP family protein refolding chaperone
MTDDEVLRFVFDPVTDSLNLTPAQRYRIVLIASSTMAGTKGLFEQFNELDKQISIAAFSGSLDETRLKELSGKQAGVMSEISATIARAKTSFYKVLTPEQRAIVLAQYRLSEQSLGGLSNVGP